MNLKQREGQWKFFYWLAFPFYLFDAGVEYSAKRIVDFFYKAGDLWDSWKHHFCVVLGHDRGKNGCYEYCSRCYKIMEK